MGAWKDAGVDSGAGQHPEVKPTEDRKICRQIFAGKYGARRFGGPEHEQRLSSQDSAEFRGAFDLGSARTLQQDVEFGVLQIVDIALKAISPAVNDPTTAISCVDQLSRILILYVSREAPACLLYDPPGVVRVNVPWIDFDGLLTSAFEQIRLYSQADIAVSLRMLRALADIASTTADPAVRIALLELGKRVVKGCAMKFGEHELSPMQVRLSALEQIVAA